MFHDKSVNISENLNKPNLLKACLQFTSPVDACIICSHFTMRENEHIRFFKNQWQDKNCFVHRNLRKMVLQERKNTFRKLKVGYLVILLTALRFRFLYFSYSLSACRLLHLCSFYNIAKMCHKNSRSEKEKYQRNDTPTCNKGSHCVTQQCY